MSILGTFDCVCLLCGGVAIEEFSTATSPMMYKAVVLQMRSLCSSKENKIPCDEIAESVARKGFLGSCQKRANRKEPLRLGTEARQNTHLKYLRYLR